VVKYNEDVYTFTLLCMILAQMDVSTLTTMIMNYTIGGLLSMVSLLLWGYLFYRQSPERKDLTILSFCAGVLSVIPIFTVLGTFGSSPITFGTLNIAGLNLYTHIETIANHGNFDRLMIYILVCILAFFFMYAIVGVIIFILDILSGEQSIRSYEKILSRSFEAPFIFVTLGVMIGVFAYSFDWSLGRVLWHSLMIGAVEEFAKHLVVRFSDENKFRNINDAIEFSIIVALGFAFLENILYFVDRIWLAPCNNVDIKAGECLFNPNTGTYTHQVGYLLLPFIFRSFFSTLAHVVSSGLFGYFYGLAVFASEEVKEYAKRPPTLNFKLLTWMHRILHLKANTIYREEKIMEGAIVAMLYHGLFDFILDDHISAFLGTRIMFVMMSALTFVGLLILFHLFHKPENKVVFQTTGLGERTELHFMREAVEKKLMEKS